MQSHNYPNFCCAEKARTVQRLMKFTRTLFSETSRTPSPRESRTKMLPIDIMGVCEGV